MHARGMPAQGVGNLQTYENLPRRDAPEVLPIVPPKEGAGNAGRPMRPIAACATIVVERTRVSQVTPAIARHSPRNGFTAYTALSPVTGFVATVTAWILPRDLTPASGCQDHTALPSASTPFVKGAAASTASCANVRDDRERPSGGAGREHL